MMLLFLVVKIKSYGNLCSLHFEPSCSNENRFIIYSLINTHLKGTNHSQEEKKKEEEEEEGEQEEEEDDEEDYKDKDKKENSGQEG